MRNGQHLMNGNLGFPNPPMYMNPVQYGNIPLQNQQHMNQQRQQHMPMQSTISNQPVTSSGDGYGLNSTDVSASGSFYNTVSNGVLSSSLPMHSPLMQASKMKPVPGLPPQQSKSNLQVRSQPDKLMQGNSQPKLSGPGRDQQQEPSMIRAPFEVQPSTESGKKQTAGEENQQATGSLPCQQAISNRQQSHLIQHSQVPAHKQQYEQLSNDHHKHMNQQAKDHPLSLQNPSHEQDLATHQRYLHCVEPENDS